MSVRVLSYPPVHDYVDRLHPSSATLVHRDEPWPELPHLYDPAWVRQRSRDWDVAHLHFTWEQYPLEQVEEVLCTHRDAGTPIVWTAHDLRNPHTPDAHHDRRYLALLAEHADHVITLTAGAADEVERRFERRPQVLPHGPMFTGPAARRWRDERDRVLSERTDGVRRLLLHLRSVRRNVDWRTPMAVVSNAHEQGVPVELDVLVLADADELASVQETAGPGVHVRAHDPLSFEELTRHLIGADALILPYRWGTHSGMLEVATDLSVPVIAGDVGYLDEQAPVWMVPVSPDGLDPAVLSEHVRRVAAGQRTPIVPVEDREQDLLRLRCDHESVYRDLVTATGPPEGTAVGR